ncbi:MAG TPA: MMPL family transporter [Sphaerochaeta sp.]|nr:MMPL family transporter [Sphaerochaeta sp.]
MEKKRLADFIIIGLSLILCIVGLMGIPYLHVDSSTDAFIPLDAPVVQTNDEIESIFGSLDAVLVSIKSETGLFTDEHLTQIANLADAIAKVDGIKEAISLPTMQHLEPALDGVEAVTMYEGDIALLAERLVDWLDFYEGTLISEDRATAAILIQLNLDADEVQLLADIRALLADVTGVKTAILGMPVVTEEIRLSLLSDLGFLIPIVASLIIIILYLFLRSVKATILSLVPLIFSSSLALGIMALFNITFTMATMLVPVLLLIVGSAYTIHIFSHFFEEYEGGDPAPVLKVVVRRNIYPIAAAAATTASGFLAQLSSPLGPFRTFGVLSFFGVIICATSSLVLLPALIRVMYRNGHKPRKEKIINGERRSAKPVAIAVNIATKWGKPLLLVSFLLLLIFLPLSYSRLENGTDMLSFFRSSTDLVKDTRSYSEDMQGSFSLSVMVRPVGAQTLAPSTLKTLEAAIDTIASDETVGGVQSIIPFIKRMNQLLGPGEDTVIASSFEEEEDLFFDFFSMDMGFDLFEDDYEDEYIGEAGGQGRYEIPSDPALYGLADEEELASLIAQYLLLYSSSLDTFINDPLEPDATLFTILLKSSDDKHLDYLDTMIPTLFPEEWEIKIGGAEAVSLALTTLVTKSQIISIFSSFIAVWLLVLLTFRSPKLATLSLIPCLFALTAVFGAMSLLSIQLDIVTSLLAALCIGVGVDYAIHLLAAFGRSDLELPYILHTTGKAILANAASVALGFAGLLFSRFTPIANLGLLFCIAMIAASLSALLVLPAIKVHFPKLTEPRRKTS